MESGFEDGEIPRKAGRLFAARRDVSLQDVRAVRGREGGWAGPRSERAPVLRHGEHQGYGRPHDRGDRQEKRENGDDFKDIGIGGREYLDVRVYGQLRDERRSRDRQRRGDASGQRSRWIPCDFGLMANVDDGYSVRQRDLDYLQAFWR